MSRHTKGPWEVAVVPTSVGKGGYSWHTQVLRNERERAAGSLVSFRNPEWQNSPPEPHPDALLTAAAPDLLEALDALVVRAEAVNAEGDPPGFDATVRRGHLRTAIMRAKTAIAKAKGETP